MSPHCMTICCSKAVNIADGLPPVLPIVLYNGDAAGDKSSELYSLIRPHPPVLKPFQPRLKFWLLDEGAFPAAELEDMRSGYGGNFF